MFVAEGVSLNDMSQKVAAAEASLARGDRGAIKWHDPIQFILSKNVRRRQLSKGQQAMFVAIGSVLITENRGDLAREAGVSAGYVSHAALVLEYAPNLVDAVIAGDMSLNDAYRKGSGRF